jgi:uncharacterized integral membrane protein
VTNTSEGPPDGKQRGTIKGVPTRVIAIGVIVVLAVWLVVANLSDVKIQFWVYTVIAPLWIALLTALVAGMAIGWLLKGRQSR